MNAKNQGWDFVLFSPETHLPAHCCLKCQSWMWTPYWLSIEHKSVFSYKGMGRGVAGLLDNSRKVVSFLPRLKQVENSTQKIFNAEKWKWLTQSSLTLWPRGPQLTRLLCPWNSPGKNTGVGSHSFLLEIFPTQGSNLGLLHCRQILYCLSHQGSPISQSFRYSLQYSKGSPKAVRLPITSTQNMWGSFSFILFLFLSFGHIIILTFLFDVCSEVLTITKLKPLIQPCLSCIQLRNKVIAKVPSVNWQL